MISQTEIDNARKLLAEDENNKRKERDEINKRKAKALVGRFFIEGLGQYADKEGCTIYRVIEVESFETTVKVESWKYAHTGFYEVKLETWFSDKSLEYIREISSIEYYHYVAKFLKKVGALHAINLESQH